MVEHNDHVRYRTPQKGCSLLPTIGEKANCSTADGLPDPLASSEDGILHLRLVPVRHRAHVPSETLSTIMEPLGNMITGDRTDHNAPIRGRANEGTTSTAKEAQMPRKRGFTRVLT